MVFVNRPVYSKDVRIPHKLSILSPLTSRHGPQLLTCFEKLGRWMHRYLFLLFNECAGMRRRSRARKPVALRLHRYGLQESEGMLMQSTIDTHVGATLRVCRQDLLSLEGRKAGRACDEGSIVALFCRSSRRASR